MNQLKVVANDLLPVYEDLNGNWIVDARELHEKLVVGKDFASWIKDRIEKYGFVEGEDFTPNSVNSAKSTFGANVGRPRIEYQLMLDTAKEIAMVENNEQGRAIRKYFIEIEKRSRELQKPQTVEDLIIMQASSMKELKQEVYEQKEGLKVITNRIDSLDTIDTNGDLQQRFNKMIQRFAWAEGIRIDEAWRRFDQSYNMAFRTNVTMRRNNYREKHGLKTLTRPQFYSLTNSLHDAVRVADKMMNQNNKMANV